MKKIITLVFVVLFVFPTIVSAKPKFERVSKDEVKTITQGELMYSEGHYLEGQIIPTGFDEYGYNYQAHFFKGYYVNAYLGRPGTALPPYTGDDDTYFDLLTAEEINKVQGHWAWPYRHVYIEMMWNDAWLSNKDRDGDEALDRHYGFDSYIGSGAWEKYKEYVYDEEGNLLSTYSCKIVAAPAEAYKDNGMWYAKDGTEIGAVIWGSFAIIEEIVDGEKTYNSPLRSGLGNW